MSIKRTAAQLVVFAILQLGVYTGAKMTQEEVERLLNLFNRTKIVQVVKKDEPV